MHRNLDDGATQRKGGNFRVGGVKTPVWIDRTAVSDLCECKSAAISPCVVLGRERIVDRDESSGGRRTVA